MKPKPSRLRCRQRCTRAGEEIGGPLTLGHTVDVVLFRYGANRRMADLNTAFLIQYWTRIIRSLDEMLLLRVLKMYNR
jgi:hypothetical protein